VRGFRRKSVLDVFDEFFREVEERLAEIEKEFEKAFSKAGEEGGGGVACPYAYSVRIAVGPHGVSKVVEEHGYRVPEVEVVERDDEVWVVADLPGAQKEGIDVKVTERTVTIKAQVGRKYYGEVELPAEVVPETAKASYKNGILEVRLKKKEKGVKVKVE
jgi:HSP20 family protein